LTLGGAQEFLGARWVSALVKVAPHRFRRPVAERLLSLSPHYFYGKSYWLSREELQAEVLRNDESRRKLMDDILTPYLRRDMLVLDYGCGPGFLARHVSQRVARVYAVDISEGVLACAKAINAERSAIEYRNIKTGAPRDACQFAYSFAVFQHLTRETAEQAAEFIYGALGAGGKAVIHVVLDTDDGWKAESSADSIELKIKRKYGLNCFSRSEKEYMELFQSCGFADVKIQPVSNFSDVRDDIQTQHILTATKPIPKVQ